jgi:hypothetical protein
MGYTTEFDGRMKVVPQLIVDAPLLLSASKEFSILDRILNKRLTEVK